MVWLLLPQHPSLGPTKYYLTAPGTYNVGRKDCTIIIQTDRTVSRLHAEIKLELINKPGNSTKCPKETITLKDLSKFGSFVNRTVGSKPVFSLPDKEISLNEGDLLTFGTDSSSFRLEYFSIQPCIASIVDRKKKASIVDAITSIGGGIHVKWCAECTHLIVEDGTYVTDVVIQAVAEKKPVVGTAWVEAIAARSSVSSEFPSCASFTPNLLWKIDGCAKSLKIVETEARGMVFKGITLYVGPTYLYNCKDALNLLIDVSGGTYASITSVSRSKGLQDNQREADQLLIIPALEPQLQRWMNQEEQRSIYHFKRTSEEKFIAAVLSGNFKEEYYEVVANSMISASSEETLEASPSDDMDEEVNSSPQTAGPTSLACKGVTPSIFENHRSFFSTKKGTDITPPQAKISGIIPNDRINTARSSLKQSNDTALSTKPVPLSTEMFKEVQKPSVSVSNYSDLKLEDVGESKADIEYNGDMIVRRYVDSIDRSIADSSIVNFKKFRKKHSVSGNSFSSLVPFAKEPYRESEYNKEIQEHMQQEKKRKQTEALAEDLFNAEQLKRKKGAGASLLSALHGGRLKVK